MKKNWQHNPVWNGKLSVVNASFIIITPILALVLGFLSIYYNGLTLSDFFIFTLMTCLTGISVTAGYHRHFSHKTYNCHPIVRFFFLVFGAATVQNSVYKWSSDHRYHHRFVDKDSDPYSIKKGFFYAHMGWIFYQDPEGRSYENAKDLWDDPLVRWQHKYYLPIVAIVGFILPALLSYFLFDRFWAGFIWGGIFRTVFVHHGTFLINSAAHTFGSRPYSTKNSARDCWWLAFFTNGEGYHNYHHAFANDYRNGIYWFQWDPSKWFIWTLSKLGLCSELQRTSDALILKARLESSVDHFKSNWAVIEIPQQVEQMKASLENKIHEYQIKWREYHDWLEKKSLENRKTARVKVKLWKRKLRAEKMALEAQIHELIYLLMLLTQARSAQTSL
ncbi:MAG: fatty acid desaturase [Oligoflexia bacterium]|nr:fatty acid desaturase [Oligoflexia bacterium]